ncbi:hypothetical protein PoB_002407300 [Plakobranchus ocellatus]|uniref:Uncharacterized protein n=1 Tax=Plakobranchus ocellatus TaxID=259542 RepID=A0AAV3ZSY1_9GAST|nr:hypothetical protein PoB_002407300 [Plakobranchus ocellatus]
MKTAKRKEEREERGNQEEGRSPENRNQEGRTKEKKAINFGVYGVDGGGYGDGSGRGGYGGGGDCGGNESGSSGGCCGGDGGDYGGVKFTFLAQVWFWVLPIVQIYRARNSDQKSTLSGFPNIHTLLSEVSTCLQKKIEAEDSCPSFEEKCQDNEEVDE